MGRGRTAVAASETIVIDYAPLPYQAKMHRDLFRFRIVAGGRRVGKSKSALHEVLAHCLSTPNALAWWVGPTYAEAREIAFDELLAIQDVLDPAIKNIHTGIMRVEFWNGSRLYFKGADRRDSLRGRGLTFLVIDEAAFILETTWAKVLRPALSDRQGQALLVSTFNGRNWFFKQYKLSETLTSWNRYKWPTRMNPFIPGEELEDARASMSEADFRQEYMAEAVTQAGQVYADFCEDNIVDDFYFDRTTHEVYIGADFGFAAPAAFVFMAVNPVSKVVTQFDEVYGEGLSMDDIDVAIDAVLSKHGMSVRDVRAVFTDPAGNADEITSGISPVDHLRKRFVVLNKGTRIAPGLQLVRSFIRTATGKRHFFITRNCENTITSMYGYTYRTLNKKDAVVVLEEPFKDGLHDHATDAVRYFFVNKFDHARWITSSVATLPYRNIKSGRAIKRCSKCHQTFISSTPKGEPPFICKECSDE